MSATSHGIDPAPAGRIAATLAAALLTALLLVALLRHLAGGGGAFPAAQAPWLALHLLSVVPTVPLGALVLFRRKGDARHRRLGRVWAGLMLVTAASSFGVGQHFGPIHALSTLMLVMVVRGVRAARQGEIVRHRRAMLVAFGSLLVAGFFTLLPQRLLGGWLFAGA